MGWGGWVAVCFGLLILAGIGDEIGRIAEALEAIADHRPRKR